MRERFENLNRDELALAGGYYGEWVWNTNATWMWRARNGLDIGWSLRRPRADGYFNRYQAQPFVVRRLDEYRGYGRRTGAYAQQSWTAAGGRVQLAAGLRWDHLSANSSAAVSSQASVAFLPRPSTRIHLGWGQYAQFPGLEWLFSRLGGPRLLPERAIHYVAALEQRLGERSRMRVEFYDREDRDLLFRPWWDARLAGSRTLPNRLDAPVENSSRGYARGFEALFQRRTANRLTGWVSYALGYSRVRDGEARAAFPADYDQRHTVNTYLGYRVRPSVNLSTRWVYGSGFPIPGFLRRDGANYFLAAERNRLRLEAYHRADVRINKAWTFDRGKLTLHGEVVNLFNHGNYRFDSFNGYNARTGQAFVTLDRMFPILPSAGVVVEF